MAYSHVYIIPAVTYTPWSRKFRTNVSVTSGTFFVGRTRKLPNGVSCSYRMSFFPCSRAYIRRNNPGTGTLIHMTFLICFLETGRLRKRKWVERWFLCERFPQCVPASLTLSVFEITCTRGINYCKWNTLTREMWFYQIQAGFSFRYVWNCLLKLHTWGHLNWRKRF